MMPETMWLSYSEAWHAGLSARRMWALCQRVEARMHLDMRKWL